MVNAILKRGVLRACLDKGSVLVFLVGDVVQEGGGGD